MSRSTCQTLCYIQKKPDNAFLIGENTYIINNIICHGNARQCVCQKFRERGSYFLYPFDSLISLVSHLSEHLHLVDVADIATKVVLLPFNERYVSIPMH